MPTGLYVSGKVFSLQLPYFSVRMPIKLIGSFHNIITEFDCTYIFHKSIQSVEIGSCTLWTATSLHLKYSV
jgi:hypothetical protein